VLQETINVVSWGSICRGGAMIVVTPVDGIPQWATPAARLTPP
jgi:hypothetical protein